MLKKLQRLLKSLQPRKKRSPTIRRERTSREVIQKPQKSSLTQETVIDPKHSLKKRKMPGRFMLNSLQIFTENLL